MGKQVLPHYEKSRIRNTHDNKMAEKVLATFKELENLRKLNPGRRAENPRVQAFQAKMSETLPFWPKKTLEKMMEKSKDTMSDQEKAMINDDIAFLQSMIGDRKRNYDAKDASVSK